MDQLWPHIDSTTFVLSLIAIFSAVFVLYVMHQSEKREERLARLIENDLKRNYDLLQTHDTRTTQAIAAMQESQKYNRTEHESLLNGLKDLTKEIVSINANIAAILNWDRLINKDLVAIPVEKKGGSSVQEVN